MIIDIFKHRDVRNRVFFTLAMLLVVRIGSAITMPSVNAGAISSSIDTGILSFMNLLSGGALAQYSILALGISPYITASIVIQLLSMDVIPSFTEWSKQGAQGKKKLDTATRVLTVALAFLQGIVLTYTFSKTANGFLQYSGWTTYIYIGIVLTAGTMFLMWLGDQITQKGVGNGISLIIFAGIVAHLPNQLISAYRVLALGITDTSIVGTLSKTGLVKFGFVLLFYLLIIVLVVFFEQATRKISIQYASSAGRGRANEVSHLPIKVNSSGVIPVIFASSMLAVPATLASYWPTSWLGYSQMMTLSKYLRFEHWVGLTIYLLMIVFFAFFYSNLQVDAEKISEDFNKSGAYIPGVRPGKDTQKHIRTVLNRLTVVGAIYLVFIAALPHAIQMLGLLPKNIGLSLGGTGMIIVVGVALETTKQLNTLMKKKSYSSFIRK